MATAGTLKPILERCVTTDVAASGIAATRVLGTTIPDCVVCDAQGWAAEGAAFLRLLRLEYPTCRVALQTPGEEVTRRSRDWESLADTVIPATAGLGELVRCTLLLCAPHLTGHRSRPDLSDRVVAALDYLRVRYAEPVAVDTVARAARVSRSRLATCSEPKLATA